MTSDEFVAGLMHSTVEENVIIYRQLFEETKDASDPYWKRALVLYNQLPSEQKSIFFEIIRQVCVDTVSNVLGIIDGVNPLDGATEAFTLTYGSTQTLSGDLQNLFLIKDEVLRESSGAE